MPLLICVPPLETGTQSKLYESEDGHCLTHTGVKRTAKGEVGMSAKLLTSAYGAKKSLLYSATDSLLNSDYYLSSLTPHNL